MAGSITPPPRHMGLIITLFFAGILLLLVELFITPGFGLSGVLSAVAIVWACTNVFQLYGLTAGLITSSVVVLVIILLVIWMVKTKSWRKLALETCIDSNAGQAYDEVSVGDEGVTISRLAPLGTARICGRTIEVKSASGMIPPSTKIVVEMIENGSIYVKEMKDTQINN